MRISELAATAGVPVPTVKFYLREGLLPAGTLTATTQAQYSERHLERLRLIRALIGSAGLSVATTRRVLDRVDHPPERLIELLETTQVELTPVDDGIDLARVTALTRQWGWPVEQGFDAPLRQLARALDAVDAAGFEVPAGLLDEYAAATDRIARSEIDRLPAESAAAAVRYVVLGTVLLEPVLLAMRRLAEANHAVRRLSPGPPAQQ